MDGAALVSILQTGAPSMISAITGSVLTAYFMRGNTATAEFEKIKAGRFNEVTETLLHSGKMTYQEYYKTNNFLKIAKKADQYYAEVHREKTPEQQRDFDWFARFYNEAGNISNERMQEYWAKILAGEVNCPGSFSLKTIDTLKNLGQEDAELFEKICSHSIDGNDRFFIPNYNRYLKISGITYEELMRLGEYGLIYTDGTLVHRIRSTPKERVIFRNGDFVMTTKNKGAASCFEVKQFPFTLVGSEIARLENRMTRNEEFLVMAQLIQEKVGEGVKLGVHKIIQVNGDYFEWEDINLLTGDEEDGSENRR